MAIVICDYHYVFGKYQRYSSNVLLHPFLFALSFITTNYGHTHC